MSATFKNLFVGTSVLAVLVLACGASAAPSLGINRPFYGSTNNRSSARSFRNCAPAYSTETRHSYSFDPAQNGANVHGDCHDNAVTPQATKQAEVQKDSSAVPKSIRRSYSYEPAITPAPQGRVSRRGLAAGKEPWQLQKTDPRRNQ